MRFQRYALISPRVTGIKTRKPTRSVRTPGVMSTAPASKIKTPSHHRRGRQPPLGHLGLHAPQHAQALPPRQSRTQQRGKENQRESGNCPDALPDFDQQIQLSDRDNQK